MRSVLRCQKWTQLLHQISDAVRLLGQLFVSKFIIKLLKNFQKEVEVNRESRKILTCTDVFGFHH